MSKNIVITAVLALMIGGVGGYLVTSSKQSNQDLRKSESVDRQPLFYRNPMNPAITSPVAAKDEMGMDYIPVYPNGSADANSPAGTVQIDATVVQNIGVRTTEARLTSLSRNVRTIGRVSFDEQRVARLHPKYNGWVEKLFADKTGDPVKEGSMLASIYSPQLLATQEEYILALNSVDMLKDSPFPDVRNGAESLLRSAHQRLKLFDVPEHQIKKLRTERKVMKGVHIHSPFDGIVMNIGARDGQRVTPETELYMIADLSHVWVIVDLYEDDLPWVREGDIAEMKVAGIPGRTFTGKVTYIYPYLEARTRTNKIRLEFDNPELALKPDMFANVDVKASRQVDAIVVPSEAIVRTGEHEQVFVQRAPGKFEPRKVIVGVASGGQTQIIKGLEAGEIVVTSGQFLIDSESKLKEATAKMMDLSKPKEENLSDMNIQGMKMDGMAMPGMSMDSQANPKATKSKVKEDMSMDHMDMKGMK